MQEIQKQIDELKEEVESLSRMLNIESKRYQVKELQARCLCLIFGQIRMKHLLW